MRKYQSSASENDVSTQLLARLLQIDGVGAYEGCIIIFAAQDLKYPPGAPLLKK